MEIRYSKPAIKYIKSLDKSSKERLKKAFDKLKNEPPEGDIKPLKGERNVYRLRVGNLRVLFTIDVENNILLVSKISPRGEVYKKG